MVLPSTLKKMTPDMFKDYGSLKTVWVAKGCKVDVKKFVGSSVTVLKK